MHSKRTLNKIQIVTLNALRISDANEHNPKHKSESVVFIATVHCFCHQRFTCSFARFTMIFFRR